MDNPATHLELTMIHEAMVLEYAGPDLALVEWASAVKELLYLTLLVDLFMPAGIATRRRARRFGRWPPRVGRQGLRAGHRGDSWRARTRSSGCSACPSCVGVARPRVSRLGDPFPMRSTMTTE